MYKYETKHSRQKAILITHLEYCLPLSIAHREYRSGELKSVPRKKHFPRIYKYEHKDKAFPVTHIDYRPFQYCSL